MRWVKVILMVNQSLQIFLEDMTDDIGRAGATEIALSFSHCGLWHGIIVRYVCEYACKHIRCICSPQPHAICIICTHKHKDEHTSFKHIVSSNITKPKRQINMWLELFISAHLHGLFHPPTYAHPSRTWPLGSFWGAALFVALLLALFAGLLLALFAGLFLALFIGLLLALFIRNTRLCA